MVWKRHSGQGARAAMRGERRECAGRVPPERLGRGELHHVDAVGAAVYLVQDCADIRVLDGLHTLISGDEGGISIQRFRLPSVDMPSASREKASADRSRVAVWHRF